MDAYITARKGYNRTVSDKDKAQQMDIVAVLQAMPDKLEHFWQQYQHLLEGSLLTQVLPIVCHLADVEVVYSGKLWRVAPPEHCSWLELSRQFPGQYQPSVAYAARLAFARARQYNVDYCRETGLEHKALGFLKLMVQHDVKRFKEMAMLAKQHGQQSKSSA